MKKAKSVSHDHLHLLSKTVLKPTFKKNVGIKYLFFFVVIFSSLRIIGELCVSEYIKTFACTGHLRYLEIKGNGETTSSFAKFEISKLRPANVLRKSQHFHVLGLSGSPFHHVYHIDSDFKRIFPDLTHDFKTFLNNSSDERLCVDIKDRFLTSKV